MNIDAAELNRLRWQCRRGLLELDLVLERFLDTHRDDLQGERLASFKTLLDYTDNGLLDLTRGAQSAVMHDSPKSWLGCVTAETVPVLVLQSTQRR